MTPQGRGPQEQRIQVEPDSVAAAMRQVAEMRNNGSTPEGIAWWMGSDEEG